MSGLVFFAGFPGFLGTELLPRVLRRSPQAEAVRLVQPHFLDVARRRVTQLETDDEEDGEVGAHPTSANALLKPTASELPSPTIVPASGPRLRRTKKYEPHARGMALEASAMLGRPGIISSVEAA